MLARPAQWIEAFARRIVEPYLVPDEVVASLCVFGSVEQCRTQIKGFLDAGASYPILITEQDVEEVIHAFAPATWTP